MEGQLVVGQPAQPLEDWMQEVMEESTAEMCKDLADVALILGTWHQRIQANAYTSVVLGYKVQDTSLLVFTTIQIQICVEIETKKQKQIVPNQKIMFSGAQQDQRVVGAGCDVHLLL